METRRERRTRRMVELLLLSFLLFISSVWVVLDDLLALMDEGQETVTVPDFEGLTLSEIDPAEWLEIKTEYRYDDGTPSGVILSQTPSGGSRRKIGQDRPTCDLTLTVSLGRETAQLPDLIGADVRVATVKLREAGFVVKTVISAGAYAEGEVYRMEPHGGDVLPVGTEVTLYAGAGAPAVTVTVPNLCGLSRGDALTRLWLSQLAVAELLEVASDAEEGIVIAQDYPPGTIVMAGTKLTLTVSGRD